MKLGRKSTASKSVSFSYVSILVPYHESQHGDRATDLIATHYRTPKFGILLFRNTYILPRTYF
jgi:hypothetical protein